LLKQPLPKTGNILEALFKTPGSRSFDLGNHFRQWKLLFHDHKDDPATKKLQDDLHSRLVHAGKTRLNLLEDWVRIIFDEVFVLRDNGLYTLKGSSDYGSFMKKQIEIVVTVPPGRDVLAHDEVREAFVQEPVGPGQVFLVSEPEAMFRSYIHDGADIRDFKVLIIPWLIYQNILNALDRVKLCNSRRRWWYLCRSALSLCWITSLT
jgi:hypothetical protein